MLAAIASFLWSHLSPQKRSKGRESQHAAPNQIAGKLREIPVFPAIETAIKVDILIVFQWVRRSSQATKQFFFCKKSMPQA
jgi:hypothetical protein